jgi:hypothetical protein
MNAAADGGRIIELHPASIIATSKTSKQANRFITYKIALIQKVST